MGLHLLSDFTGSDQLAVVPVLVGPFQALMAILPALLTALAGLVVALFKPSTMKKLSILLWSQKIPVTCIILVVAAVFYFVPPLFSLSQKVGKAEGGSDWPIWRGSVERRGAVIDDKFEDPGHGGIGWTFTDGDIKTFYSSAAVVGNRVYLTSARKTYFKDEGGVYSLEAETGKPVWQFKPGGYRATFSSPAVAGKYLVVGEGLHFTTDSRVFCLDIKKSEEAREGNARSGRVAGWPASVLKGWPGARLAAFRGGRRSAFLSPAPSSSIPRARPRRTTWSAGRLVVAALPCTRRPSW